MSDQAQTRGLLESGFDKAVQWSQRALQLNFASIYGSKKSIWHWRHCRLGLLWRLQFLPPDQEEIDMDEQASSELSPDTFVINDMPTGRCSTRFWQTETTLHNTEVVYLQ